MIHTLSFLPVLLSRCCPVSLSAALLMSRAREMKEMEELRGRAGRRREVAGRPRITGRVATATLADITAP